MYSIQEQFKTNAFAQMDGRVRDAQAIAVNLLDLSREIGMLNVRTTKTSAEQLAVAMQKLLGAGNPGEFLQIAASVMRPDMQLWTGYVEQFRSIAGKAGVPLTSSLTPADPVAEAPTAPVAEAPAVPEQMQEEEAIEPAPEAPLPVAATYVAALEQSFGNALQTASETLTGTVEAFKEVAEAMTGVQMTAPVATAVSTPAPTAVSTPAPEEAAVPDTTVARKKPSPRPARKQSASPVVRKTTPSARSASGRARKG